MNIDPIINNLQNNKIAENMLTLFDIRDDLRTTVQDQGALASDHGFLQMLGDGQEVDGDIATIIDEIQDIIGDVEDGGVAVTIKEKLEYLIHVVNQVLYEEDDPDWGAHTISEAVYQLIEALDE